MIYLPGEGPSLKKDLAEEALSKILGKPMEKPMEVDQTIIEQVIALVTPEGTKKFPQDFIEPPIDDKEFDSIVVAGTPLQFAAGSNTLIISPKKLSL